jgi:hypothetical protein
LSLNIRANRKYEKLNKDRELGSKWSLIGDSCPDTRYADARLENLKRESRKLLALAQDKFYSVVDSHNKLFGRSSAHGTKLASIHRVRKRESKKGLEKLIFKYNAVANIANEMQPGLMMLVYIFFNH